MQLIDIGVNFHSKQLAGHTDALLTRARKAGVCTILATGTSLGASNKAVALADSHRQVYATAGVSVGTLAFRPRGHKRQLIGFKLIKPSDETFGIGAFAIFLALDSLQDVRRNFCAIVLFHPKCLGDALQGKRIHNASLIKGGPCEQVNRYVTPVNASQRVNKLPYFTWWIRRSRFVL